MLGRLWILFALSMRPAVAQSVTTGTIKGHVVDEDGIPVPGVAIQIDAEQLMGVRHVETDTEGRFLFAELPPGVYELTAERNGFTTVKLAGLQVNIGRATVANVTLRVSGAQDEIVVEAARPRLRDRGRVLTQEFLQRAPAGRSYQSAVEMAAGVTGGANPNIGGAAMNAPAARLPAASISALLPESASSSDRDHGINGFTMVEQDAHSTFSIDVDTASYALSRRFLREGTRPPEEAVRVEEFVNYLRYRYPQPEGVHPFAADFDLFADPLRDGRHVLRVGVQGAELAVAERPPLHLTFLVDVSGSMSSADKLPLAQQALHMLVDTLQEGDTVALATYAGRTAEILQPTGTDQRQAIHEAIGALQSGGSTAMSSGLDIAYGMALRSFEAGAENRVIVLSDGDANVGRTSPEAMLAQIKDKADRGITLSTIGFGMGNYQDALMEHLANKGDGNNYYIDSMEQARRVFVEQVQQTVLTIARDVKLQVIFDPRAVMAYRLIGYENRAIADEDFRDDRVDAGEVGAGHSVTALYEVILMDRPRGTVATLSLRYEAPGADKAATEVAFPCTLDDLGAPSADSRAAYAAATFAEILRGSPHVGEVTLGDLIRYAEHSGRGGADDAELLELMRRAQQLAQVSAR